MVLKLTNSLHAEFVKKETEDEIRRKINEFKIVLGNLKNTLSENPSLSGILEPQITLKQEEMNAMMNQLSDFNSTSTMAFSEEKISKKIEKIKLKLNESRMEFWKQKIMSLFLESNKTKLS